MPSDVATLSPAALPVLPEIITLEQDGAASRAWHFAYVGPPRLVAGTLDRWRFEFTARHELPACGRIAIAHRWPSDWGAAQATSAHAPDFLDARTSAGTGLRWWSARLHLWHPFDHVLFVELADPLPADAKVILGFGGDARGPGFRVQSFVEEGSPFSLRWRAKEGERWSQIAEHRVEVVGDVPFRLVAVAPSRASTATSVALRIRVEDQWGNPASLAAPADVVVTIPGAAPLRCRLPVQAWTEVDAGILPAGTLRLAVEAPSLGLSCTSNAIECAAAPVGTNVYWADLHAQSVIGCGARTIDAYYAHARDFAALDACSHQANCFLVSGQEWEETARSSREHHRPHAFVPLLGFEWSAASALGGDHNVYFPGDEGELRRCSHEFVRDRSDAALDLPHVEDFYRHYQSSSPLVAVHVGGRTANLKWHDPGLDRLLEVHSTHATSEWFLREALERGYRMGVIAGSDSVDGRPGNSHPGHMGVRNVRGGLTAILAEDLTRESLWAALRQRHCYATTGERILLDLRFRNATMGDDVSVTATPAGLTGFEVQVEGTAPIERIDFFRDVECIGHIDRYATRSSRRLRVAWRGASAPGNWQRARMRWDGTLRVEGTAIERVEGYAFDTPDEGVLHHDPESVQFESITAGDWDGVILDLSQRDGTLVFATEPISARVPLASIGSEGRRFELDNPDRCLELRWLPDETPDLGASLVFNDPSPLPGTHAYWIRVRQADGALAWSSPIFVTLDAADA